MQGADATNQPRDPSPLDGSSGLRRDERSHAVLIGAAGQRAFEQLGDGRAFTPIGVSDMAAARAFLAGGLGGAALVLADAADLPTRELLSTAHAVAVGSPELALGYVR